MVSVHRLLKYAYLSDLKIPLFVDVTSKVCLYIMLLHILSINITRIEKHKQFLIKQQHMEKQKEKLVQWLKGLKMGLSTTFLIQIR